MLNRMTQEKLNDSVLEFNKIIAERVKISSGNTAKVGGADDC